MCTNSSINLVKKTIPFVATKKCVRILSVSAHIMCTELFFVHLLNVLP